MLKAPGLLFYQRYTHYDLPEKVALELWESEQAATATIESGFYDEQSAKFLTVYRQPPGRGQYRVSVLEGSAAAALAGRRGATA
jgi:hypothetical protein